MEKSLHTVTQRASGAQLSRAWLKTGGSDVYAQGLLLQTLGPYAPEVTLLPSQMGYVTIDAGRPIADIVPVSPGVFGDFCRALWALPRRADAVSGAKYVEYVRARLEATGPDIRLNRLFEIFGSYLNEENEAGQFVHGDLSLCNILEGFDGKLRTIDVSPRPTPTEPRCDVAKLLLSIFVTDTPNKPQPSLLWYISDLFTYDGRQLRIVDPVMAAHFVAHAIRVAAREPTRIDAETIAKVVL
jgi:hypothetical protein